MIWVSEARMEPASSRRGQRKRRGVAAIAGTVGAECEELLALALVVVAEAVVARSGRSAVGAIGHDVLALVGQALVGRASHDVSYPYSPRGCAICGLAGFCDLIRGLQ